MSFSVKLKLCFRLGTCLRRCDGFTGSKRQLKLY